MENMLTRWEFTFPAQTTEREFSKFIVYYINLSRHHEGESFIPEVRIRWLGFKKGKSFQTTHIVRFTKAETGVIAETATGNHYHIYDEQISGHTKQIIDDLVNHNKLDATSFRTYA